MGSLTTSRIGSNAKSVDAKGKNASLKSGENSADSKSKSRNSKKLDDRTENKKSKNSSKHKSNHDLFKCSREFQDIDFLTKITTFDLNKHATIASYSFAPKKWPVKIIR